MSSSATTYSPASTATSPINSRAIERAARRLRWSVFWAWAALLGIVAYAEIEFWLRALHPAFFPLAALCLTLVFEVLLTLFYSLRLLRKLPRLAVIALFMGLTPPALLAWPLARAARVSADRYSPNDRLYNFATVFGAAVMHAEAMRIYPHRKESPRLVMLYGDSVRQPEEDLRAMDAHVARLEKLLGRQLREKIWWIRGPLFGRSRVSFLGLSLGSENSPSEGTYLDQHELAHGVIEQFKLVESDPPAIVMEGWAEAQSGATEYKLCRRALLERTEDPSVTLRELVSDSWYHRHDGPIYEIGGAFASYLLKRFGPATFLDLYVRARPGSFIAFCPLILGVDFETLERDFWKETERIGKAHQ